MTWGDADGNLYLYGGQVEVSREHFDAGKAAVAVKQRSQGAAVVDLVDDARAHSENLDYNECDWSGFCKEIWRFSNADGEWEMVTTDSADPAHRAGGLVWQDAAGRAYVFGGVRAGEMNLNDLWVFTPQTDKAGKHAAHSMQCSK